MMSLLGKAATEVKSSSERCLAGDRGSRGAWSHPGMLQHEGALGPFLQQGWLWPCSQPALLSCRFYRKARLSGQLDWECIPCTKQTPSSEPQCRWHGPGSAGGGRMGQGSHTKLA